MKKPNYNCAKILGGVSALALSLSMPMQAQDADSPAPDEESRRLNTVEVTATRREGTTIQDVPIAVTALDPQTLERAGVRDIRGLDTVAPSFNMNSSDTESGGTTLRIRGVGTTGNNIGLESSVGVFLDGVYLSRPGIALADLLDVAQVEVLRGPQGTLFGRNTSAGALNITTQKPNLDEQTGFANLTVGNFDLVNIQAGVNLPISENFAVRLSGAVRDRGGFVEGLNGQELSTRDRISLRGQALYDAGDAGEFRVILDYADGDDDCCDAVFFQDAPQAAAFAPAGLPNGPARATGDEALDDFISNSENYNDAFEQTGLSLTYENDIGFADFTYIGSWRDYESNSFRNNDYTGLNIFTVGASPEQAATGNPIPDDATTIETITHEARLQGLAFDDRLDWLVGLYYSTEDIEARGTLTLLDEYQGGVTAGIFGSPVNLLNAFSGGVSAAGDFATNDLTQEGESFSIFTHNVFNVTDQFNVTLGLRYVDETKDGNFTQVDGQHNACNATFGEVAAGNIPALLAPNTSGPGTAVALNCFIFAAPVTDPDNPADPFQPFGPLAALLPQEFDDTFEDDELVYTIKAGYEFNDNVNVYAGYTHGFKSGGFNLDAGAAAGGADPRFDSEIIDAFELGLKATVLDGRGVFNAAVFHQEMEDFQVLEFTGVQFQTFNVDEAKSTGAEVETQVQWTDNFSTNLGVTYTDARYPDECTTFDQTSADFNLNAATLCGNPLTNSPEWVTILGGNYEQPIADGKANLFITGSVRHETERRTSTQALDIPSLGNVQAGLAALGPNEDASDFIATFGTLPGDFQEENTKVNLRVGIEAPDERWAIELWGNNITDERTKNVTFNIPLRGSTGTRARGQFVQDPATYGVTLRTKF